MKVAQTYNFKRLDNEYYFSTDHAIEYLVAFTDASFILIDLPLHIPVFDLSIQTKSQFTPFDARVSTTVVAILHDFFAEATNSIVYVCESLDNRQRGRARKFDQWFQLNAHDDFEKYDVEIQEEGMEILASLILKVDNPFRLDLINVFLAQPEKYSQKP
jgi:Family of unknown function (DUF6169)